MYDSQINASEMLWSQTSSGVQPPHNSLGVKSPPSKSLEKKFMKSLYFLRAMPYYGCESQPQRKWKMPKYYIQSGKFKTVIDRNDAETAVLDAFRLLESQPVESLGCLARASEHGFIGTSDPCMDDDFIFETVDLLEKTGLIGRFKPQDWA
jgi:hypothetical protein